jgi:methyl acetate hydrolase
MIVTAARAPAANVHGARRIDAALRAAVEAKEVPGVVAMAATDQGPIYAGAFGTRALGTGAAMTPDTLFRIASMTKPVTCGAAMQLVEQGKLTLDGPLPDIDKALSAPQVLDGFDAAGAPQLRPAKRPITLRHLDQSRAPRRRHDHDPDPAVCRCARACARRPVRARHLSDAGRRMSEGERI